MTDQELQKLKFPIGSFNKPELISENQVSNWIAAIEHFPQELESIVHGLSAQQLNWRYRPNGWMIKQVVHHCADSHINAIIRFKLALTEDLPEIRPYHEDRFANLIDSQDSDLTSTLNILNGVHAKLGALLRSVSPTDLKRQFVHPEHGRKFDLDENMGVYAWHGQHHLAHIKQAILHQGAFND